MRFTKEFKLECIRKHKAGEHNLGDDLVISRWGFSARAR